MLGTISDQNDGPSNQQQVKAIRDAVARDFSASFPFLLMPVRLETRFMKAERPQSGASLPVSALVNRVIAVRQVLSAIAARPMASQTTLTFKHAQRKAAEATHYQFLEQQLSALAQACLVLVPERDNVVASQASEIDSLHAAIATLRATVQPARLSVAQLHSNYQREHYAARLDALCNGSVEPMARELERVVALRLELGLGLRAVTVASVTERVAKLRAALKNIGQPSTFNALNAAFTTLSPQLTALRADAHAALRGTLEELALLRKDAGVMLDQLDEFVRRAGELSVPVQNAAAKAQLVKQAGSLAADVSGLRGGSSAKLQVLSTRDLQQLAEGLWEAQHTLHTLSGELSQPLPPLDRRDAAALAQVERVAEGMARVVARARGFTILPESRPQALRLTRDALVQKLAPWQAHLETLALTVSALGRQAASTLASLKRVLAEAHVVLASLRTDSWAVSSAGESPSLRKVYALTLEHTKVVDELWIRIYPDDVAIHTHEPALTTDEVTSARQFWLETKAAGDDALRRAAWRGLVARHGVRRAAYLAHRMEPTLVPVIDDPAPWPGDPSEMMVASPSHAAAEAAAPELLGERSWVAALRVLDRRLADLVAWPGWFEQDPSARLAKVEQALDGALAALLASRGVTVAQRAEGDALLSQVRGRVHELEARLARRGRFIAAADRHRVAIERLSARVSELERALAGTGALKAMAMPPNHEWVFPSPPLKGHAWTEAPHTKVLPERFVALTVSDGVVSHVVSGEPVPARLDVGISPSAELPAESFELDELGDLRVDESIRWLTDFDAAVAKGMAMRITLSPAEAARGFDELFVLGVRNTPAEQVPGLVEELLDNHHYGEEGLGLLPIGTPTNNTDKHASGHRRSEDVEAAYDLELGAAPLTPGADVLAHGDGARLALALGVKPKTLQHIANATGQDARRALLANRALFPGTLGGYLEEFLGTLISVDSIKRLSTFFVDHVSARGLLPALRVGNQPYGMLVTSAFSRFGSAHGTTLPSLPPGGPSQLSEADRARRFDILLIELLSRASTDWSRIRKEHVKHAHGDAAGEPQQHFMDMLGLHATSVGAEYRFALNVATRHPGTGAGDGVRFGMADQGPRGLLTHFQTFFERAFGIASGPVVDPAKGLITQPFKQLFETIFAERVFDVRVLSSARPLLGPVVGEGHAAIVSSLLAESPAQLMARANAGGGKKSLLELLLCQALLFRLRWAALEMLQTEGMLDAKGRAAAGSADEYIVRDILNDHTITKWSYLFAKLGQLDGRFGISFHKPPQPPKPLFAYLGAHKRLSEFLAARGTTKLFTDYNSVHRPAHDVERNALEAHAQHVSALAQVPKAELEELVYEHLDLCSHRLDAWLLGLANRRLTELRAKADKGLFLGAYGWLENLRPGAARTPAADVPSVLHVPGEAPIYDDADDQGFVHAPSLTHAVTAAILRSGYLSDAADPDRQNRMAVNLSSRRVRLALSLLDGVESGQDLGALLGYRFERELHDAAGGGLALDQLIPRFRRVFPAVGAVDPQNTAPELSRRLVTDGLKLLDHVRGWVDSHAPVGGWGEGTLFELLRANDYKGHPWGIVDATGTTPELRQVMPAPSDPRLDIVLRAIDRLADALDAIGDLALSESVFQIARGNFPRASAVMAALAEGKALPRPQVVDTPRTGTTVTHRVLLPLPVFSGVSLSSVHVAQASVLAANRQVALPAGWADVPMSARANAEPGLNHWLGQLLGPASSIVCRYLDVSAESPAVRVVSARELGLQPLDLLAMLGAGLEQGAAELGARIVAHALPAGLDLANALEGGTHGRLDIRLGERDPAWPVTHKTFHEVAALLGSVHDMLGHARALDADDLTVDEALVEQGLGERPGLDLTDLSARALELRARLRTLARELMALFLPAQAPTPDPDTVDARAFVSTNLHGLGADVRVVTNRFTELAPCLLRAAALGISAALPPSSLESVEQTARGLVAAVSNALVQVVSRLAALQGQLAEPHADAARLREALRAGLGKGFVVVPHATPRNAAELSAQLGQSSLLREAGEFAVDEFLQQAALVRNNVAQVTRALALGEAFGYMVPVARVAQLPARPDDYWLGARFPADHEPAGDRMSLVVLDPARFTPSSSGTLAGLLVDEWSDLIPNRTETTGVGFFYDTPDATPPQAMLLVVPPRSGGMWSWDDLVHTLHDTLELARNRTVELEHLRHEVYGQLLPAVIGEVKPDLVQGESSDHRVVMDLGRNR